MRMNADNRRLRNLDRRPLVLGVLFAAAGVVLGGLLLSPYRYTDPRFAIGFFGAEVALSLALLAATLAFFPAGRIGFRRPRTGRLLHTLPLAAVVAVAAGAWILSARLLPPDATRNVETPLLVLRSTALVGLNEEWIFRGFLLAALCRWAGFRRGAFASLVVFGLFHLLNLAVGVTPAASAFQVGNTILVGASLLLCALATRSLVLPALAHALFDFAVIDMNAMAVLSGQQLPLVALSVTAWVAGLASLVLLARLRGDEPYAD